MRVSLKLMPGRDGEPLRDKALTKYGNNVAKMSAASVMLPLFVKRLSVNTALIGGVQVCNPSYTMFDGGDKSDSMTCLRAAAIRPLAELLRVLGVQEVELVDVSESDFAAAALAFDTDGPEDDDVLDEPDSPVDTRGLP